MRRLFLALLILPWPSIAVAAEPFARAAIENKADIVPGQQVRLDVDILVPDFFTSPPQFPLFEVPNALVTLPEERAYNITETVDGVAYSGIRKAYAIIPQTAGTFTLPPITVELGYPIEGKPSKATVTVPSVTFDVKSSGATAGNAQPFPAGKLTVTQSFDRDLRSLKVGDAVVRTITVSAENTQAIVMPAVEVGTATGLRQYAKTPRVEDGLSDGRNPVSRRTETYVYTADKSGNFEIPAVSYVWFDVADRQTKTASLPAIELSIAAADQQTAIKPVVKEAPAESPWIHRRKTAAAILSGLALLAIAYAARGVPSVLAAWMAEFRARRVASYSHRLKLFRQTIANGEEKDIYRELQAWSRSLGYRTLAEWAETGSHELRREIDILSGRLFGSSPDLLDRKVLAANIDIGHESRHRTKSALPPLNPSFPAAERQKVSALPSIVTAPPRAS
ncbi:MAG: hypothetical protein E6Q76_16635 [Rhizobium sp.]|nr:MAG: hypothetical protein E6Q76_16635 [Rhizobium sp.]